MVYPINIPLKHHKIPFVDLPEGNDNVIPVTIRLEDLVPEVHQAWGRSCVFFGFLKQIQA